MRAFESEIVENREAVLSHVFKRIATVKVAGAALFLRQAHVAVVEDHDADAPLDEFVQKCVSPTDHLDAEPFDEQRGNGVFVAAGLVVDASAGGLGKGHGSISR